MSDGKSFLDQVNEDAQDQKEEFNETNKQNKQHLESFQKETFEKTKRKMNWGPAIIVFLFLVLGLNGYYILSQQKTDMIDLVGLDETSATEWAAGKELLVIYEDTYDHDTEAGYVMAQSIPPGQEVKAEDTVVLTISLGRDPYAPVDLPAFDSSWSRAALLQWIEEEEILNFTLTSVLDEEVEEDYLISYQVTGANRDTFNRSSTIDFILSDPVDQTSLTMTNLLGQDIKALESWALENGIDYGYDYQASDIYEENQVLSQNTPPGEEVLASDDFYFVISSGPSTETVEMVSLYTMSLSQAQSWLKENQLTMVQENQYSKVYPENTVIDQDVPVGETINKGSSILLTVSVGDGFQVPDFSEYEYSQLAIPENDYEGPVLIRQEYREDVPINQVVSQSIDPGQWVSGDQVLEVVYSLGNELVIKDYRGESISDLKAWIDEVNKLGGKLSLEISEDKQANGSYGTIQDQNLKNQIIGNDAQIHVTISTGYQVLDFSKYSMAMAEQVAADQPYPIEIKELYSDMTEPGDFILQTVPAGDSVTSQTAVTAYYSLGGSVLLKSFINQTIQDLEAWVAEMNDQGGHLKINTQYAYSQSVDYDHIISMTPSSGDLGLNSQLDVIVSQGESILAPDFEGLHYTVVDLYVEEDNYNVIYKYETSDETSMEGIVLEQSPEAGERMGSGQIITITLSE